MSHHCPISLSRGSAATAALVLLLNACSDLALPSDGLLTIANLLVLDQQANAPTPASRSFWVSNSRSSVERINHPDAFNTLYLELTFPAHSLVSLDGSLLTDNDSVYVTVDPRSGTYGFILSPADIVFSSNATPSATFSFSVYGDASSGGASQTYTSNANFVAALDIWREVSVDRWQVAPGSRSPGIDSFIANVKASGQFILAAPG